MPVKEGSKVFFLKKTTTSVDSQNMGSLCKLISLNFSHFIHYCKTSGTTPGGFLCLPLYSDTKAFPCFNNYF